MIKIIRRPTPAQRSFRRATELYASAGLHPVHVRREVEGFVFNRLQGALLREAYCLVRDGVADVADIDAVVRDGPGPRSLMVGPLETVDLNTRGGIEAQAARMGPACARMSAERGQHDPWTRELVAAVAAQRRADLPLADRSDRSGGATNSHAAQGHAQQRTGLQRTRRTMTSVRSQPAPHDRAAS